MAFHSCFTREDLASISIFCRILASLSGLYFDGGDESAGERSMVIVMFFVYLFVAMMVLVVDEDTLETGLDDAYDTFNRDECWNHNLWMCP